MFDAIYYLSVVLLLALVVFGAVFVVQKQLGGGTSSSSFGLFGPKPYRRIGVVDHVAVDGKRRLILLRRDDVEHLIMTGGPVDVVIETGISPSAAPVMRDHDHVLDELTAEPLPPTLDHTRKEP